jgi:hypothetical protein
MELPSISYCSNEQQTWFKKTDKATSQHKASPLFDLDTVPLKGHLRILAIIFFLLEKFYWHNSFKNSSYIFYIIYTHKNGNKA